MGIGGRGRGAPAQRQPARQGEALTAGSLEDKGESAKHLLGENTELCISVSPL